MWPDRGAAGQGGPVASASTGSLPYSPARRQSQLSAANKPGRPSFSPRSSSLSFSPTPNASTTSLPGAARAAANGFSRQPSSAMRNQSYPDPVDVLNGIIGQRRSSSTSGDETASPLEKPDVLCENIDFGGLSLEEFAHQKETQPARQSYVQGLQSFEQYEKDRNIFEELHNSITGCDELLKSVESYLTKFQAELGAISSKIESLQSRSFRLSSQLENRKNVERILGPAVEKISVSPRTVRSISDRPIDQEWVKALSELDTLSSTINADTSTPENIKAIEDVRPLLKNLQEKAVERIRDFLVTQIKAIRSPNMNGQVIQQQSLLKYKDLYTYLSTHHPTLSEEITQAYVNTMRWYYLSNFTRYSQALDKLKLYSIDRNDLLGGDASSQRTAHGGSGGRSPALAAHDPLALGRRMDILKSSSHMALSSYLAEEDKSTHGLEIVFRNFNLALIDNISAEYSFMAEMFSAKTIHYTSQKVTEIFEPTLASGQALTKQLIETTTDCIGILLCVRLNQQFAFEMQRRKVPVADPYINGINMQLWPRFQMIMDMHLESLKRISTASTRSGLSVLALTSTDAQSSAPHFLTQRFGQFLHSILTLCNEAGDDEPIFNSLGRLVNEFDALLTKLSKSSGDAKRRERFLFNNYSLILTIISDAKGKLATDQKEVIGAGVVGLAVARQLAAREGTSTILVERHSAVGTETSSRNSEVIHAGLYYGVDSLKTKLCIEGKEMLYELCEKQNIPHRNTKKWIVAQDEEQWKECLKVFLHAKEIGVPIRFVSAEEAKRREPDVRAEAGILESPTTGIVDAHSLMSYLHGNYEERGGDCVLLTEVYKVEPLSGGAYEVFTRSGERKDEESSFTAETLINCAGHFACGINNMILPPERHRTPHFAKGTYFSYAASSPKPSTLLYPAPRPSYGGLGTHLTLDMAGRIKFGPDVEWVDSPDNLIPSPKRLTQAIKEIQAYLPSVNPDAIGLDYCGIRPKLIRGGSVTSGKNFQDFVIQEEKGFPGFINLLGIESPGLTSSLAIAKMVENLLYR
ncbi:Vps52/Sac2 family protein [Trichophyton rubrum]|uniref:Vps52/Sac2 family protein n=1 Tax=Trichophyton rubrum TaxID=5551 RepID=A0A178EXK4_TRIRU|nr:Vps52/Sac2 family protein [Trichophyton rubrum]